MDKNIRTERRIRLKLKKILAPLLALALALPVACVPAAAKSAAALRIAVISDPHVLPETMTGGGTSADFLENTGDRGKPAAQSEAFFAAALADVKRRAGQENLDFLLIPGDLTLNSEYDGHVRVTQLLKKFEKETGVKVAVVPGNHDINHGSAADYSTGVKTSPRRLQAGEFLEMYAPFGYDLPNCEIFEGTLNYAADLGGSYRLIAIDTNLRSLDGVQRTENDLRDWAVAQCEKAAAAGKTVVGMGHHNLAEQFGLQEAVLDNFNFDNVGQIAEDFADAGMHYYFSGHIHLGEIAMRVSDRGEPLYDICVAASIAYPGEYRTVKFSAAGGKSQADVRSHPIPYTLKKLQPPFDTPYYSTLFGLSFGGSDGDGLAGYLKGTARRKLEPKLRDMKIPEFMLTAIFNVLNDLIDKAMALPMSELPCTRFLKEYKFGGADKPGTVEDLGNSAVAYMFGRKLDPKDDAFVQDALRRIKNGEFVDQALEFAVPELLTVLSAGTLAPLLRHPVGKSIQEGIMSLAVSPAKRAVLSESLYHVAKELISGQSPTGGRDGLLKYNGPMKTPTAPGTYRLPQDLRVRARSLQTAEITWYTRPSATSPEVRITDADGNPVPGVKVAVTSKAETLTVEQVDIAFAKLLGRAQPALKHTARVTGLKPGATYKFTAGDSAWQWWSEPQTFTHMR